MACARLRVSFSRGFEASGSYLVVFARLLLGHRRYRIVTDYICPGCSLACASANRVPVPSAYILRRQVVASHSYVGGIHLGNICCLVALRCSCKRRVGSLLLDKFSEPYLLCGG
eukprot:2074527-Amphidinium_carterae.1